MNGYIQPFHEISISFSGFTDRESRVGKFKVFPQTHNVLVSKYSHIIDIDFHERGVTDDVIYNIGVIERHMRNRAIELNLV